MRQVYQSAQKWVSIVSRADIGGGYLMVNPGNVNEGPGAAKLAWHHAQACGGGECVEVAGNDVGVTMRNSGDPATTLTFTRSEWLEFISGIKAGDFDQLGLGK